MTLGRVTGLEVNDVADGIVVYRPADDTMHHLNALAAVVFELCDGRTQREVARGVAWLFALPAAEAAQAVEQAVADLSARALIR